MIALSEELSRRLPKARLSVSIPAELAQWTRETAKRNGVPISAVVEVALRRARRQNDAAAAAVQPESPRTD